MPTASAGIKTMKKERFMTCVFMRANSARQRIRPVGRRSRVCFPNGDGCNSRSCGQRCNFLRSLVVKIFGDILRRRIDLLKGGQIIQELVVQRLNDVSNNPFQMQKIAEQADRIHFRAFQRYPHLIIVAVGILTFSTITAQGMASRESFVNANLKHALPLSRSFLLPRRQSDGWSVTLPSP